MPFEALAAGPGEVEDYLVRGFVEDVITELSRFRDLEVLSPVSTLARTDSTETPWAELGVTYLLRGSFRIAADTLRVTAQLSDATSDRVVWAERYDAPKSELIAVQDELVSQVVGALSIQIEESELARVRRKPIAELEAYDCWLRGLAELRQGSLEGDERARVLFQRALEIDPTSARSWAGMSLSYFNEWSCQLWDKWDDNERHAFENASRALELDEGDHVVRLVLGRIYLYRRDFERAEQHLARALSLNPNDADHLVQLALGFALLDNLPLARQLMNKALRLNPFRGRWYHGYDAQVRFMERDYPGVLEAAALAPPSMAVDMPAYAAAALAYLGRTAEAREKLASFQREFESKIRRGRDSQTEIEWLLHVNPYRSPEAAEHFIEGLVRAGIERAPTGASAGGGAVFRHQAGVRYFRFEGREAHLPEVKGFGDLEKLLERPVTEVRAAELAGVIEAEHDSDAIDPEARAAYRRRIEALRERLEVAEKNGDPGRAEAARRELDEIARHLAAATGLGGRPRKLSAPAERARSAVTQRIRAAIRKIEVVHPPLARHLRETVATGRTCAYRPPVPVRWQV